MSGWGIPKIKPSLPEKEKPVEEKKPIPPMRDWLAPYRWALNEMRTHDTQEEPGKLNNQRILFYHAHTTLDATDDETPWCAAFLSTALEESGFPSTHSAAAASYANYGVPGDGSIGDIAVFKRTGGHHVAFINKPYKAGDPLISILGGNQHDCLCVENHDTASLIAIRRVRV